jgi:hypothetical protein
MELISELLKILLPASLVLYGMYITVQSFINSQKESALFESKIANKNASLPMRLQAYERICLLLERITPNNLLVRLNGNSVSVSDFHQVLVNEIREEFNHNLSQQVYMSDMAWSHVRNAVESTIGIVNEAAGGLDSNAAGIELSKNVLKTIINSKQNAIETALAFVKDELRRELY